MSQLAPIAIFTYRRNIEDVIENLLANTHAKESELYIFSDGYKGNFDKQDVLHVRKYLKTITGFKKITISESLENKGLANSIIDGVSIILQKYEKVIVLEDDLIVSENFLEFMNSSLDFYKNEEDIWSISGYTPKLACLEEYNKDVYLAPRASSWGWATWSDRWMSIDWEIQDYENFIKNKASIAHFNEGGNDLSVMLKMQMLGKIDSWAIRWCYNQYKMKKYTVYPTVSRLINIGFDEKGTHNSTGESRWSSTLSSAPFKLEKLEKDKVIFSCFAKKYNLQLKTKIGYFLKEYGGYKLVKKLIAIVGK